jgi:hypothetical protein
MERDGVDVREGMEWIWGMQKEMCEKEGLWDKDL